MIKKLHKCILFAVLSLFQLTSANAAVSYTFATVDFEFIDGIGHVPAGFQYATPDGVGVGNNGFHFAPGPAPSPNPNDLHIHTDIPVGPGLLFPNNATSVGGSHDDAVLTRIGGGTFDLYSFDYAGYGFGGTPFESPVTVTGFFQGGGTISQTFTPDGVVDGQGGAQDFQTFFMTGDCGECEGGWYNLVKVEFTLVSSEPLTQGSFALDNINVGYPATPVPEPSTLLLFGIGLLGLMQLARRNKRA